MRRQTVFGLIMLVGLMACGDSEEIICEFPVGERALIDPEKLDSVELELTDNLDLFLRVLRNGEYEDVKDMLHPDGVWFYTTGKVNPDNFNPEGLAKATGFLDGAYAYGLEDDQESDSVVSGMFWLDSVRYNYRFNAPEWHSEYTSTAYGFTGNYSSDHLIWQDDFPASPDSLELKIAYIPHNNPNIDTRDILMVEFFQTLTGDWKVYAIGNLEWTP